MDDAFEMKKMKNLFEGDGELIREQFIYAGLLLTIFERFKTYIVDHVDSFFAEHTEIIEGRFKYKRGNKFKEIIKYKTAGNAFRGALHWFQELNAISLDDLSELERLYSLRNDIGHELLQIILDDQKPTVGLFDVLFCYNIYCQIVRWWIKEVEVATDPDMTEEKYDNIDWDEVETIETILLRELLQKALSNNKDWIELNSNFNANGKTTQKASQKSPPEKPK